MKGGCDRRAPLDSDKSMEGAKVVSETWGVYHSPEEFVAKAVEAGASTWHETMPSRSVIERNKKKQGTQHC